MPLVIENTFSLDKNEIFDAQPTCSLLGGKTMREIVSENILSDYRDGIRSGSISVFCSGIYKNQYGEEAFNFKDGYMLDVGDVVRINTDNKIDDSNNENSIVTYFSGEPIYYKIVSREFVWDGNPTLNLGLQECILVRKT